MDYSSVLAAVAFGVIIQLLFSNADSVSCHCFELWQQPLPLHIGDEATEREPYSICTG